MDTALPLKLYRTTIAREWVDYNGHMNDSYHLLIFHRANELLLDFVGLKGGIGQKAVPVRTDECHLNYLDQLKEGDKVEVLTRLIAADRSSIHLYHEMLRATDGALVAAGEFLLRHGSHQHAPKAARFEPGITLKLQRLQEAQASLPSAKYLNRAVSLRSK